MAAVNRPNSFTGQTVTYPAVNICHSQSFPQSLCDLDTKDKIDTARISWLFASSLCALASTSKPAEPSINCFLPMKSFSSSSFPPLSNHGNLFQFRELIPGLILLLLEVFIEISSIRQWDLETYFIHFLAVYLLLP
jgi:hypothetical protein